MREKKRIKIGFVDFWPEYEPENSYIISVLRKHFNVEIIDTSNSDARNQVEYLFYSCFSQKFLDFDCIRIFFTGENLIPDFNLCDYAIGFENMVIGDRYFRDPLWYEYIRCHRKFRCDLLPDKLTMRISTEDIGQKKFCGMVVSNGVNADIFREDFFHRLSDYKKVDSGGRFLNNIGLPKGVEDKISFLRDYKFSLAFENVSHEGYCTEKIIESFVAGTIPIYWGDPDISKYFNKNAFINCHDFLSVDTIIEKIKEIDQDDEKYYSMIRQPIFVDDYYTPQRQDERFEEWLISIFEREYSIRRNRVGTMKSYEDRCKRQRDCYN